ncbi:MAG: exo-alpha-sialidase [Chloroflexia bacterium]|nr:exo-alpha-sialidase [Chloroflexia bacterium]
MVISILASLLSLIVALAQGALTVQVAVGPIVVGSDQASRIVDSHPGADALRIAGSEGLYEAQDGDWTMVAAAPPSGDLVGAGGDSGLMLAGDHEPCLRGGSSMPLQRSDDGGQTWTAVEGAEGYRPLAIWPDRDLALASSCLGLHVSLDSGQTWNSVEGINSGLEVTTFADVPQTDDGGPLVLVGLTGEGGTSYLHSVDFSAPSAPIVSEPLKEYYAIGALAGEEDTYVLAALDGVWISDDAGVNWERSRSGLEAVTTDEDPLLEGLPADMSPDAYGLNAVALLPGERPGMAVGSVDGLYVSYDDDPGWIRIEGTSGQVNEVVVNGDGTLLIYATDEGVFRIDITTNA